MWKKLDTRSHVLLDVYSRVDGDERRVERLSANAGEPLISSSRRDLEADANNRRTMGRLFVIGH